ncbi:hypothetical protein [Persicobacter diffluens]|uniref:Lipoprotein n=1 Tax=Persicobacter diffluens TaxID=981 RepID=A0AAN4W0X2_9BACT|nr:hypothetical protein PEDI_30120 [Persicobacter diffluens]
MKVFNLSYIFALLLLLGCMPEDPRDLVSNERAIESFFIPGYQVGPAEIDRKTTRSEVYIYLVEGMDLSAVSPKIEVSRGSTIIPASERPVDLTNKKTTYTVTSASGENREWTVFARTFSNAIDGKWFLSNPVQLFYHIGEGESWGWSGQKNLEWSIPGFEYANDNSLTFKTLGVDEKGNVFGEGRYDEGADGQFETFERGDCDDNPFDYAPYYGHMVQGDFEWVHDLSDDVIIFTQGDHVVRTMPLEWSDDSKIAFNLAFSPEAYDLGWCAAVNDVLELNFGKRYFYPFIKEGENPPVVDPEEPTIPATSPISLNGDWGITDIGFWPSASNDICADLDNILKFSNESYDAVSGILAGDFVYDAGEDGVLTDVSQDAWRVFPERGTFELKVLEDPEDATSRKHWAMTFHGNDGSSLEVDGAIEGEGADDLVFKFNGGKDLSTGNEVDAHWYKFQRNHVGKNPCNDDSGFGDFISGNWGRYGGTAVLSYYDGDHKQYPGAEIDNDNTYTFSNVVEDGKYLRGDITVDAGADGQIFDAGTHTLRNGTFTFEADRLGEWGEQYGFFTLHTADGQTVQYKNTANWFGDFQIKFDKDGKEIYYRIGKQ